MRKISAQWVYTENGVLCKPIVYLDRDGWVVKIEETGGKLREEAGLEYYSGILTPGFVNAHCHLELSHLRGKLPEGEGMSAFLKAIPAVRQQMTDGQVREAIELGIREMLLTGTVAVGDIVNTTDSLEGKLKSRLISVNFAEVFVKRVETARESAERIREVQQKFEEAGLCSHIVAHAPYTMDEELWGLLSEEVHRKGECMSVHFMETKDELRDNAVKERFYRLVKPFERLLLVHNLYSGKEDMEEYSRELPNAFYVLCPRSNLYIQDKLPDLKVFLPYMDRVCLGTDSLASNKSLSLLEEVNVLISRFEEVDLYQLLGCISSVPARALGLSELGSIEVGKRPGLNLISSSYPYRLLQVIA